MQTITPISSPPEIKMTAGVQNTAQTPAIPESPAEHGIDAAHIAKLENVLAQHNIALRFSRDDATKSVVVQMIDQKTGEAVRQFPTEVSLSLAANFLKLQGVFLDAKR